MIEEEKSELKGEVSKENGEDGDWEPVESCSIEAALFTAHVSLQSILGIQRKNTMKVRGEYEGEPVSIAQMSFWESNGWIHRVGCISISLDI